jgi:hypothetical protein
MSECARRGWVKDRDLGDGVTEYEPTAKMPLHLDLELCLDLSEELCHDLLD